MNFRLIMTAGLMIAAAGSVSAAQVSGKDPVMCGLFEVQECLAERGCERVKPHEVNLRTRFLEVDFKKRMVRAKGTERSSKVDKVYEVGNKLVLAGAAPGDAAGEDGVGFSMTITKDNGHMVMAVTGDEVSFVVFGACTTL